MQPLDRSLKIRFPSEMMEILERRAAERGPGTKLADLVREAVYHYYSGNEPIVKPLVRSLKKPSVKSE